VKKLRVYLDTSVIGGCFDPEFEVWSNALVADFEAQRFQPAVSELVAAEVEVAPANVRTKFDELLKLGAELLRIDREALELAGEYSRHGILPPKFRNDLLHIAVATVADVDVLVSWNFKHIVRLEKIRLYSAVNLEAGYKPLQIYSPREVASYED
jgi:predicted nucleic acid-binding protein